jgi:UDP-N-acetylglucosamine 1-carboxyvinyltransferase
LQTAVADALKQSFVIEGGNRLSGSVRATGNKNAALPILAACVLTDQPIELENVPRIKDVDTMLALLRQIGGEADWTGPNDVRVHVAEVATHELDEELCREIRASILLAGPLLARCGKAVVPPPGGDVIGRRRLDTHIHALDALGARIAIGQHYELEGRLTGTKLFLDEASVTATENAVMAAVLASGETVIGNAACEPHVQDVCEFLVSLGARIDGIGTNRLRVEGVGSLGGGPYRVCPEHIEVASLSASPPSRTARSRSRTRRPTTSARSSLFSPGSACTSMSRGRASMSRRARSSPCSTISAVRSRRSRTAPGPRSRPT